MVGGAFVVTSACVDGSAAIAPDAGYTLARAGGEVMSNPQPVPPRELFRFRIHTPESIDNPNLREWTGRFSAADGREGLLAVANIRPAVQRGQTLHLRQRCILSVGGDRFPAVQVDGTLNLRSGRLTLAGHNAAGARVQIRGQFTAGADGGSIGGDVMFNPQPDPPKTTR